MAIKKKKVASLETNKGFQPIRSALDQAFSDIDRVHSENNSRGELSSGFQFLNDLFIGQDRPRFSIISSPTRLGGTTYLGATITAELSMRFSRKIACFSMLASSSYYSSILLSANSNVDFRMLRFGKVPKEQWPRLSTSAGRISESDIYIDDTRLHTVKTMRESVQELVKESKLDLIVIDNLQYISNNSNQRNRANSYQETCQSLLDMSLELSVSILLLSQFSGEYDLNRIELAHDCQSLLFLQDYGETADSELCLIPRTQDREDRLFNLYVYYNREGPTGAIRLRQKLEGGSFGINYT
jgi:replicative DNA helicase